MKKIEISKLDQEIENSDLEKISETISSNPQLFDLLKRYDILGKHPEKFNEFELIEIYYNRYYWFLLFSIEYQKIYGYDAGIEQQELLLLEEGESYSDINWAEIERISSELKK